MVQSSSAIDGRQEIKRATVRFVPLDIHLQATLSSSRTSVLKLKYIIMMMFKAIIALCALTTSCKLNLCLDSLKAGLFILPGKRLPEAGQSVMEIIFLSNFTDAIVFLVSSRFSSDQA
jgi:hypothetical protein